MPRFQKRAVFFDAVQWFPGKTVPGVHEPVPGELPRHYVKTAHKQIVFLEPGDWIIPEPDGSGYYPCKDTIFPTIGQPVGETEDGPEHRTHAEFLALLKTDRGAIVSSADCSEAEIAWSRAADRFFVDGDGCGYVFRSKAWLARANSAG